MDPTQSKPMAVDAERVSALRVGMADLHRGPEGGGPDHGSYPRGPAVEIDLSASASLAFGKMVSTAANLSRLVGRIADTAVEAMFSGAIAKLQSDLAGLFTMFGHPPMKAAQMAARIASAVFGAFHPPSRLAEAVGAVAAKDGIALYGLDGQVVAASRSLSLAVQSLEVTGDPAGGRIDFTFRGLSVQAESAVAALAGPHAWAEGDDVPRGVFFDPGTGGASERPGAAAGDDEPVRDSFVRVRHVEGADGAPPSRLRVDVVLPLIERAAAAEPTAGAGNVDDDGATGAPRFDAVA
ncbi:MAG: hypothetical protein HY521_15360 [Proteobacteria bacterium]|nr:hypothetical protein [Pseudomonadota bacterium]